MSRARHLLAACVGVLALVVLMVALTLFILSEEIEGDEMPTKVIRRGVEQPIW